MVSKFLECPISGKINTKRIERKNLMILTRIKCLARKIICFSKSEIIRDIRIGLFINFREFCLTF